MFKNFQNYAAQRHDDHTGYEGNDGDLSVGRDPRIIGDGIPDREDTSDEDGTEHPGKKTAEQGARDRVHELPVLFLQRGEFVLVFFIKEGVEKRTADDGEGHDDGGGRDENFGTCFRAERRLRLVHGDEFVLKGADDGEADPRDGDTERLHQNTDADDDRDARYDGKDGGRTNGVFNDLFVHADLFCASDRFDDEKDAHKDDGYGDGAAEHEYGSVAFCHAFDLFECGKYLYCILKKTKSKGIEKTIGT